MFLQGLYLSLNVVEYPPELGNEFALRTRSACNFVQRRLARLRFRTMGFKKVCIEGSVHPSDDPSVVGDAALLIRRPFDLAKYRASSGSDELNAFFAQMILEGVRVASRANRLPVAEIEASLAEFSRNGFVNRWSIERRRFGALEAELVGELTVDEFGSHLVLRRGDAVVADVQPLKTKPDELIFQHRVKSLDLREDHVLVLDKFGRVTFSQPVHGLTSGAPER